MIFKKFLFSNNKICMAVSLWEFRSDLILKDAAGSTEGITGRSVNYLYLKTLLLTVSPFASTSLSHCFSLLSPFLYSNPFRNIEMHCEITDRQPLQQIYCWNTTEKRKLEKCFWAPEVGWPNRYTGLSNGLNMPLMYIDESELLKKNHHRRRKRTRRKNDTMMSDAKPVNDKDKMEHVEGESQEYDDYEYHKDVHFKLFYRRFL